MPTIEELKNEINKLEIESHQNYTKQRKLKKQLEQIKVDHLLASGILNKLTWEIQNEQRIGCVDGSWYKLTKEERNYINFEDGSNYRVVDIEGDVSLSYNLDDGELWISSSDTDSLIEFIKNIELQVDGSRLVGRKQDLIYQLDDVCKLLNTFGVEE